MYNTTAAYKKRIIFFSLEFGKPKKLKPQHKNTSKKLLQLVLLLIPNQATL